jgi:hypothetical protein
MIRKNVIFLSLIFFLTNCGFTPVYLKNTDVNFSVEQVNYTGDRELNNFLKTNLSRYKNKNVSNKVFIDAQSKYDKVVLSKDGTGEVTNYQLEAEVVFVIKSTNKQIVFSENIIMKSITDKFEEDKFEKSAKQNFASSVSYKLISKLIIN